ENVLAPPPVCPGKRDNASRVARKEIIRSRGLAHLGREGYRPLPRSAPLQRSTGKCFGPDNEFVRSPEIRGLVGGRSGEAPAVRRTAVRRTMPERVRRRRRRAAAPGGRAPGRAGPRPRRRRPWPPGR